MIHILEAGKVAEDGDDGKKLRDDGTKGEEYAGEECRGLGKGETGREARQDIQAAADNKDDERMTWKTIRGIIKRPQ